MWGGFSWGSTSWGASRLRGVSAPPSGPTVVPSATSVRLEFGAPILAFGAALSLSNWSIEAGPGVPTLTLLSISFEATAVVLSTKEHLVGGSYTLHVPPSFFDGTTIYDAFDRVYVGVGIRPFLTHITPTDTTHLDITFSEEVSEADAVVLANYTLVGPNVVVVQEVERISSQSFRLTTTPQIPASSYTLQVNNVRDNAGNTT